MPQKKLDMSGSDEGDDEINFLFRSLLLTLGNLLDAVTLNVCQLLSACEDCWLLKLFEVNNKI